MGCSIVDSHPRFWYFEIFFWKFLGNLSISPEDILYLESIDITEHFRTNLIENEGSIKKWISIHAFCMRSHIYLSFSFKDFWVLFFSPEDILYLIPRDISEQFKTNFIVNVWSIYKVTHLFEFFFQIFLGTLWISPEDILNLESIDITEYFKINFIENE